MPYVSEFKVQILGKIPTRLGMVLKGGVNAYVNLDTTVKLV